MDSDYSALHAYAEAYSGHEPALLNTINRETYAEIAGAKMLSGHLQGRVLATFSHMVRPRRILEIGTYTGYSALCLAEGLTEDGILHTIDINTNLEARVKKYFERSARAHQIQYHIGPALEIIPKINEKFDLIFIDADKKNYIQYYELSLEKLNLHGFIIVDNVLWKGKVCKTEQHQPTKDKYTQTIINFNNAIQNDPRVDNVLFPIRDGLMVIIKK